MINFYFADFAKLVLAFFLTIHQPAGKPAAQTALLSPGDNVHGMILSKSAEDAHSLWAFCFNSPEGEGSSVLDCRVPAQSSLRIGNLALYANESMPNLDWSDLVWELSMDGQPVDLEPFGTFDYVLPGIGKMLSSPGLETFQQDTGWNIALTDLEPGHHTLWLVAESKTGSYSWLVNLDIEPVEEANIGSIPFSPHS